MCFPIDVDIIEFLYLLVWNEMYLNVHKKLSIDFSQITNKNK